jgi:hypothetical protein
VSKTPLPHCTVPRALFCLIPTEADRRNAEEMTGADRPCLTYGVTRPRSMHRVT